jgi:hypothetical protein
LALLTFDEMSFDAAAGRLVGTPRKGRVDVHLTSSFMRHILASEVRRL